MQSLPNYAQFMTAELVEEEDERGDAGKTSEQALQEDAGEGIEVKDGAQDI